MKNYSLKNRKQPFQDKAYVYILNIVISFNHGFVNGTLIRHFPGNWIDCAC